MNQEAISHNFSDFNLDSPAKVVRQQGHGGDVNTLSWSASLGLVDSKGTPKPAPGVWDEFRESVRRPQRKALKGSGKW